MRQEDLSEGVQVIYVPPHANGDINHHDCEHGFISTWTTSIVFCRFWLKGTYTAFDYGESCEKPSLRTTSCSEPCHIDRLVVRDSVKQDFVDSALKDIREQEMEMNNG